VGERVRPSPFKAPPFTVSNRVAAGLVASAGCRHHGIDWWRSGGGLWREGRTLVGTIDSASGARLARRVTTLSNGPRRTAARQSGNAFIRPIRRGRSRCCSRIAKGGAF